MALETKEPQGKILFKRTDISTMKKDIKMLRELDLRKEQVKSLQPLAPKAPVNAEAEKQRVFALKSEVAEAQSQLKKIDIKPEAQLKQQQAPKIAQEEGAAKWEAERKVAEAKKQADELEAKNKEAEAKKAELQQKIAQTNDALRQAKPVVEEKKVEPQKPAPISEDEHRKKFMEDIEAWANSDKK